MLRALVFDMDGTITVLTLPLEDMRRDTKSYYISKGLPAEMLDEADGISSSTRKARNYFLTNGVTESQWRRWESEVDVILSKHEGFAADTASLIDDALGVVDLLRKRGIKTAILTNNGRPAVDKIMNQIPLADYFDAIQTRHESPRPKPYPDGLLKIASELGLSKNEMVYVGDALIDAVAARRAGVEFWGVATGETPSQALADAGASMVFKSLSGLLEEVESRLGNA
jgi:HAD superfamily hydrolase (TIGR01549 family)